MKKKRKKDVFPSLHLVFGVYCDFDDIQMEEIPPSYCHITSLPSLLKLERREMQFPEFPVAATKENDR